MKILWKIQDACIINGDTSTKYFNLARGTF